MAIAILLTSVVIGGLSGYFIYRWQGEGATTAQSELWQHAARQREAQAYFWLLRDLETGGTNDLRRFGNRGRTILNLYVQEVANLKKRYGYDWLPLDSQFYKQAQQYLADHPAKTTNSPISIK